MGCMEQKTLVGVPFYDGEGDEVLSACLHNLDSCLNKLNVDARIVIGINGPRVSMGKSPLSRKIDKSRYNADISFVKTPPGLVAAEKVICAQAEQDGYERVFLTDADISRLPQSLSNMWRQSDKPVAGANYSAYPLEILSKSGINLSNDELALMRIFEADKHPLAREFTSQHRPKNRLKGSLLLLDPSLVKTMFGNQSITSDSGMNRTIPSESRQLIPTGAFLHYARINLADHIQARLRHFRAAAAENSLDSFVRKSLMYNPNTAEEIAKCITDKYPQAINVASDFLLQCALRHQVALTCRNVITGRRSKNGSSPDTKSLHETVHTFDEATKTIACLISQIDFKDLDSSVSNGRGVTQTEQRIPIDLEPFLLLPEYRQIITSYLGLENDARI